MGGYLHVCTGTCGEQAYGRPLELELEATVSCPGGVELGTELGSYVRAVHS